VFAAFTWNSKLPHEIFPKKFLQKRITEERGFGAGLWRTHNNS